MPGGYLETRVLALSSLKVSHSRFRQQTLTLQAKSVIRA